jgi:hypothetical protein
MGMKLGFLVSSLLIGVLLFLTSVYNASMLLQFSDYVYSHCYELDIRFVFVLGMETAVSFMLILLSAVGIYLWGEREKRLRQEVRVK